LPLTLTQHASRRAQQRAMRHDQIEQMFLLSDLVTPVNKNVCALRVSRTALAEAIADGLAPAEAQRLSGRTMLLADDGAVVTLAHLHGRRARAYRQRDRRPYWKDKK
jgi:hypothetical protein